MDEKLDMDIDEKMADIRAWRIDKIYDAILTAGEMIAAAIIIGALIVLGGILAV